MEGTGWQEVNRKVTEFYNAMKECDFFFVQSGDETDWFIEFQIYVDKNFIRRHMNEEIFPDSSKKSEILAQFAGDFSIHTFENDYFCDCWLRYYIGVSREVAADAIREHINNKIF